MSGPGKFDPEFIPNSHSENYANPRTPRVDDADLSYDKATPGHFVSTRPKAGSANIFSSDRYEQYLNKKPE